MSLNCILVSINTVRTPYVVHPLGMAHIAGALRQDGHRVVQYDVLVEDGIKGLSDQITECTPDLIGISIRNVDTVDSADPQFFLKAAMHTIGQIKSLTSAPIVLGGGAFTLFPDLILKKLEADYGVVGEGERAICELASALCAGNPPPKGTLIRGRSVTHNQWDPVPDRPVTCPNDLWVWLSSPC